MAQTKRTPVIERAILGGLAEGKSLPKILAAGGMPDIRTVQRWMEDDATFAGGVARARKTGAQFLIDEGGDILDTADDSSSSAVQKAVSRANWRKWLAGCFDRGSFGDKQGVELSGPAGGPVQFESIIDLVKRVAQEDEECAPDKKPK